MTSFSLRSAEYNIFPVNCTHKAVHELPRGEAPCNSPQAWSTALWAEQQLPQSPEVQSPVCGQRRLSVLVKHGLKNSCPLDLWHLLTVTRTIPNIDGHTSCRAWPSEETHLLCGVIKPQTPQRSGVSEEREGNDEGKGEEGSWMLGRRARLTGRFNGRRSYTKDKWIALKLLEGSGCEGNGVRQPGAMGGMWDMAAEDHPHILVAVLPWKTRLTSLSLCFLLCKTRMLIIHHRTGIKIKRDDIC